MGSQSVSSVQQSAYVEAANTYIDIDEKGNQRVDSKGNPLNLSRKFAIYRDDTAAGFNDLNELAVMFEPLLAHSSEPIYK